MRAATWARVATVRLLAEAVPAAVRGILPGGNMKVMARLTDAEIEQIVASQAAGESMNRTAKLLGRSHTTISRLLDRSPEIRRRIERARKVEVRRARDRAGKAERRARALSGAPPGSRPEWADDAISMSRERAQRAAEVSTGNVRVGGGGRSTRGYRRSRVSFIPLGDIRYGQDSFGYYGARSGSAPDWWLDQPKNLPASVASSIGLTWMRNPATGETQNFEDDQVAAAIAAGWVDA